MDLFGQSINKITHLKGLVIGVKIGTLEKFDTLVMICNARTFFSGLGDW